MGMDGISISNTGAVKEQTSAEFNGRVEQTIASDPTNSSQQVQELANNRRVHEKEENEENQKKQKIPTIMILLKTDSLKKSPKKNRKYM